MTAKPKRRFFQIHLSTALIATFLCGALLWANTQFSGVMIVDEDWIDYRGYGWPFAVAGSASRKSVEMDVCFAKFSKMRQSWRNWPFASLLCETVFAQPEVLEYEMKQSASPLRSLLVFGLDFFTGAVIVCFVVFVLEWRIVTALDRPADVPLV